MRFQFSKAPVYGLMLSLCSLPVFADDSTQPDQDLGTAIGNLLGGYIKRAIAPTNTNVGTPTQPDSTMPPAQQAQPVQSAPLSAEDQAYLAKGLWHDPNTGLIWSMCRVGETWSGSDCIGTPTQFDWPHAMLAARDARLDGHNDWRVPSMSEYLGIMRCSTGFDAPMYGEPLYDMENDSSNLHVLACRKDQNQQRPLHVLPNHFKFDVGDFGSFNEWSSSFKFNYSKTQYFPLAYSGSEIPTTPYKIRLVRGGNTSKASSFPQALQVATTVLKLPALRAKEAKAWQDNLNRKTANLRQNVREGDRTSQGLVIEVKGNLVKVQTYKNVCTEMSTGVDPYCRLSQKVVGDEVWVNRNDLTPIK